MEFDYVIVGAGSAGCVLANRLSEDSKNSVLLLEAGGKDKSALVKIPFAYAAMYNTSKDWKLSPEPLVHANNQSIFYPRGKLLGGSSSINQMVYIRGNRLDYDEWSSLGNDGWSYDEILPYFKKSENYYGGANDFHGVDGPLGVTRSTETYNNDLWEPFEEAAKEIGLKENSDFNGADQIGFGYFDLM